MFDSLIEHQKVVWSIKCTVLFIIVSLKVVINLSEAQGNFVILKCLLLKQRLNQVLTKLGRTSLTSKLQCSTIVGVSDYIISCKFSFKLFLSEVAFIEISDTKKFSWFLLATSIFTRTGSIFIGVSDSVLEHENFVMVVLIADCLSLGWVLVDTGHQVG